jgi:organic radical activating enzyme
VLTGGEPLIHSDFLLEFLPLVDFRIYLETNGVLTNELKKLASLISVVSMDIKLPSSTGLKDFYAEHKDFIKIAQKANREIFLKAVVSNKITDAEVQKLKEFSQAADLIIQPISTDDETLKLTSDKIFEIMDKIPSARVIPQCHKFLNLM